MSSFFQNLLSKLFGPGRAAPSLNLAAFGKHPGWNDHIDDLGLESDRLVEVKRTLYVEGIGGNIDSGAWDKLDEEQRLPAFRHLFLWHRPDDLVVGRFWSSTDGKGRGKYPMVVCAQTTGLPVPHALNLLLPALARLEADCQSTTDPAAVRQILDSSRSSLRHALAPGQPAEPATSPLPHSPLPPFPHSSSPLPLLASRPEMGEDRRGLYSILYQIDRDLAGFRPDRFDPRSPASPRHLRVPCCADSPQAILLLWLQFLLTQLDPAVPMLILLPLIAPWVDLFVGEPTALQFYCARTSLSVTPLTTKIPYNLDPAFIDQCNSQIASAR